MSETRSPARAPLPGFAAVVRRVLATELLGLVRDRRALFSALVLPMMLYPLLFIGQGWLDDVSRETLESRTVTVTYDLSAADPALEERVLAALAQELPIELVEVDAAALLTLARGIEAGTAEGMRAERHAAQHQLEQQGHVLLVALASDDVPPLRLRAYYDGTADVANEARKRVVRALDGLSAVIEHERLVELVGDDPARGLAPDAVDLASERDTSGAFLGRYLPLVAIFVLLSGGSYAALTTFAGEREAGTLETLLVQPVRSSAIAWGKLAAVLLTALATLVCNGGSLVACAALGLGSFADFAEGAGGLALSPGRLLAGTFVFLPAVVLLTAVLCLVCGRARTFREGQHVLLPLMLVAILPALPAMQPDVDLDVLLAAVPLCGPSLALRDALRGDVRWALTAWSMVAHVGWSWLALSRLAGLLDAEKLLQSHDDAAELAARRVRSRRALRFGFAGVLAVYVVGGALQQWEPVPGLLATLLVLLPVLALWCARSVARPEPVRWRDALGLRLPRVAHAAAALCLAPPLVLLVRALVEWQMGVLPIPSSMMDESLVPAELRALPPLALVLVLGLAPGLGEELFFRGAVLSGLRRDLPPGKVIAWQALLFGAVHASLYRFLPTALLGALLAALTLRARSLWPAVLLHTAYNALAVLSADGHVALPRWTLGLVVPGLLLALVPGPRARAADRV